MSRLLHLSLCIWNIDVVMKSENGREIGRSSGMEQMVSEDIKGNESSWKVWQFCWMVYSTVLKLISHVRSRMLWINLRFTVFKVRVVVANGLTEGDDGENGRLWDCLGRIVNKINIQWVYIIRVGRPEWKGKWEFRRMNQDINGNKKWLRRKVEEW